MFKRLNIQKRAFAFTMMIAMVFTMMISSISVFASSAIDATQDKLARQTLTQHVQANLSQEKYAVDGGGYLSGSELFEQDKENGGFTVKEDEFQTLTSSAQTSFVEDIAQESQNAIDKEDNVSESTVQNWWKELQSINGIGSKFMNEILKNTKPDFVTANAIYQPFSGVVGTVMGVIAVLLMAFLGIVLVCDICYIALPPVRNLVADEDGHGKIAKSKMFSYDAIYAVQCAEQNSDNGSGGGKQALGIYLKRRIVMLIILGICLMYLVNGQIYTAVGWILDLVSGFLGF